MVVKVFFLLYDIYIKQIIMNIRKIIKEEIDKIVSESDRHKEGNYIELDPIII